MAKIRPKPQRNLAAIIIEPFKQLETGNCRGVIDLCRADCLGVSKCFFEQYQHMEMFQVVDPKTNGRWLRMMFYKNACAWRCS